MGDARSQIAHCGHLFPLANFSLQLVNFCKIAQYEYVSNGVPFIGLYWCHADVDRVRVSRNENIKLPSDGLVGVTP